jgi:hypothetical protein
LLKWSLKCQINSTIPEFLVMITALCLEERNNLKRNANKVDKVGRH